MMTFYPGPSKVYPQLADYLQDAVASGILSVNHRSQPFMDLLAETIRLFKQKLNLPADYQVYFVSSATECWEIIAQSLVQGNTYHCYNGAFGKKWFEYTAKLGIEAYALPFGVNEHLSVPRGILPKTVCCFTHNETSNGTALTDDVLESYQIARTHQGVLLAIDATSSMGGVNLPWQLADVWFASVQKCFGLPAGLGVMVCSPQAIEQATRLNERNHYNSLLFIHENFAQYQTPYTPNVLGIYLLNRVLQQIPTIAETAQVIKKRAKEWYDFFENNTSWNLLAKQPEVRSDTVITVSGATPAIQSIKSRCKEAGITLGNGYGEWKDTTFRIANFPAIEQSEIAQLKTLLID
ncbi:MAG: aminotransferase class V-fold PLP-dependent enzyme [Spirosomataceae bacterium]